MLFFAANSLLANDDVITFKDDRGVEWKALGNISTPFKILGSSLTNKVIYTTVKDSVSPVKRIFLGRYIDGVSQVHVELKGDYEFSVKNALIKKKVLGCSVQFYYAMEHGDDVDAFLEVFLSKNIFSLTVANHIKTLINQFPKNKNQSEKSLIKQ